jgi:hypothetical protein
MANQGETSVAGSKDTSGKERQGCRTVGIHGVIMYSSFGVLEKEAPWSGSRRHDEWRSSRAFCIREKTLDGTLLQDCEKV